MDPLPEVTVALLDALAAQGVPHALAGGLAANVWVPTESIALTVDVDAAALQSEACPIDVDYISRRLTKRTGLRCLHSTDLRFRRASIVRFLCSPGDIVADVVLASRDYAAVALSRVGSVQLAGKEIPVLAPEDVILYKGLARREKDFGPIAAVARAQKLNRAYIQKWARRLGIWRFVARALRGAEA